MGHVIFIWQVLDQEVAMTCPLLRAQVAILSERLTPNDSEELWPFVAQEVTKRHHKGIPLLQDASSTKVDSGERWNPDDAVLQAYWVAKGGKIRRTLLAKWHLQWMDRVRGRPHGLHSGSLTERQHLTQSWQR